MKKIKLTKGLHALVSDEDFERINQHKWFASEESRGTKFYAARWITIDGKRLKQRMHHEVLQIYSQAFPETYVRLSKGFVVDHLDGDSLDNRRTNLEIVTQTENMRRSKGWKKKKLAVENA